MNNESVDLKAENQQLKDTVKKLVKENNLLRRLIFPILFVIISFAIGYLIGSVIK